MTLPSQIRGAGPYTGNGSNTSFNFHFAITSGADLRVVTWDTAAGVETIASPGYDYTVTINSNQVANPGGAVVYKKAGTAALKTGDRLTIVSDIEYQQATDLPNGGSFNPTTVESMVDEIAKQTQQLAYYMALTPQIPASGPYSADDLTQYILDLGDIIGELQVVAANASSIATVAGSIGAVTTVSANVNYVETVALNMPAVETVYNNLGTIALVASDLTAIDAVAADIQAIHDVGAAVPAINTINLNIADVNTVAGSIGNVNAVGNAIADVSTVALNTGNINAVAGDLANINKVAADLVNIDTVAGDLVNIDAVAGNKANIDTVAGNVASVTLVAGSIANVNAVAANAANIDTVAGSIANVNATGAAIANVNSVAADLVNIDAVAGDLVNIDTVAGISTDITTIAPAKADIQTVAANITDIVYVSNNVTTIVGSVAKAKAWAENPEDVPVEPGEFSAFHWAQKAAALVGGGVINDAVTATDTTWSSTKISTELTGKVDTATGYGLSKNDFTDALLGKLNGVATGAQVNVKADWNAASGDAQILNKPGNATTTADGFMAKADKSKLNGIATGAEVNVQSDWNAGSGDAFIKNKPALGTAASKTVVTSDTDSTSGRVLTVGSGGLLTGSTGTFGNTSSMDNAPLGTVCTFTKSSAQSKHSSWPVIPEGSARNEYWTVETWGVSNRTSQRATFTYNNSQSMAFGQTFTRQKHDSTWGPWRMALQSRGAPNKFALSDKWEIGINGADQLVFQYNNVAVACITTSGGIVSLNDVIGFFPDIGDA